MSRTAKRLLDVAVAGVVLTLTAPVLSAAMVAVRTRLGSPVIFRQVRTGREGRPFEVLKLRTMTDARDADGRLLPDTVRLTRLGRLLRATSVDELPQLVNVLRGDMSLVGPRPLLPRYDPWYTDRERQRFAVRPGITGLAQVNGRNAASWDVRLDYDVRYAQSHPFGGDLRILARTALSLVRPGAVVVDPAARMRDLDEERRLRADEHATDRIPERR